MSKLFVDFIPAELRENKSRWYVRYYVKNPATGKLHRKCVKLNRIKSVIERRKYGRRLVHKINNDLENGWNPFLEQDAGKSYHNIYDVFDTYISVKNKELRSQSMRSYRSNMKILKEFLQMKDADKKMFVISFDKNIANEFMNYMYIERNVSERRYNGMLIFCKILFSWMIQFNYIKSNPFEGIKKKKEKEKKREIIPLSVRNEIREYLSVHDFNFLVFIMTEFYALLRPNEILNLKISDIDLINQTISVNAKSAKNGKYRLVTVPNQLISLFNKLKLYKYPSFFYVFSDNLKPGKNLKQTKYAGRRWLKLRKELNFKKEYQMYSLRDTGIINLLQSGISPEEVAKQAGHSDLSITSIYALHANKTANEQIKNKSKEF